MAAPAARHPDISPPSPVFSSSRFFSSVSLLSPRRHRVPAVRTGRTGGRNFSRAPTYTNSMGFQAFQHAGGIRRVRRSGIPGGRAAGRAGGGRELPRPLSGMPQKCARRVLHVDHVRRNLDRAEAATRRSGRPSERANERGNERRDTAARPDAKMR